MGELATKLNEIENPISTEIEIMDFSTGMPLVSVDKQKAILEEYSARRNHYRKWLLSQLKQGVHYGFPPGCEVELDENGDIRQKSWDKRNNQYKISIVRKNQWQAKPSLYKAGAQLIIDLLPIRATYETDLGAWEMAGKPAGVFFRTCKLVHSVNGSILGEGTGAFKVGEKGMQENSAIKMADKRAMVAAVINTIPVVADLFTQDIEDIENEKQNHSKDLANSLKDEKTESEPIITRDFDLYKKEIWTLVCRHLNLPDNQWIASGKKRTEFFEELCFKLFERNFAETVEELEKLEKILPYVDWNTAEIAPDGLERIKPVGFEARKPLHEAPPETNVQPEQEKELF